MTCARAMSTSTSLSADEGSPDAPVLRLLQSMFHDAAQVRASDIHIEPGESNLRIRMRVDGVLQEQVLEGRRVASALVTRLKLMCGLDIAEKRLPQDGRFSVRIREAAFDIRLATMPTTYGESVVMRLLDQSANLSDPGPARHAGGHDGAVPRDDRRQCGHGAGHRPHRQRQDHDAVFGAQSPERPGGEDHHRRGPGRVPLLERINQVQVNAKIGLDFARVLRTALRQDPDILLVGEMRDRETVEIGLRAAMTGHMVFSTLHTINAVATVNRLVDMGAAGYMVAAALHGVVAQRLARRNCENCAHPVELSPNEAAWLATRARPSMSATSIHGGAGLHLLQPHRCARPDRRLRDAGDRPHAGRCDPRSALHEFSTAARQDRLRAARPAGHRPGLTRRDISLAEAMAVPAGSRNTEALPAAEVDDAGAVASCSKARLSMPDASATRAVPVVANWSPGRLDAESIDAVATRSDEPRHHAARDRARRGGGGPLPRRWRRMGGGRPTNADLMLFSRQMYTIVKSGVPLLKGLRGLAQSTHNLVLRDALHDIVQSLESGRDLASSLARHPQIFPPLFLSIMRRRRIHRHARAGLRAALRVPRPGAGRRRSRESAMRYPLIVVGAVGARARGAHRVRDPELRAAVQGAGRRHPLADPHRHGRLGVRAAALGSLLVRRDDRGGARRRRYICAPRPAATAGIASCCGCPRCSAT